MIGVRGSILVRLDLDIAVADAALEASRRLPPPPIGRPDMRVGPARVGLSEFGATLAL